MKKLLLLTLFILLNFVTINTLAKVWQPAPGYKQIPIWPTGKISNPRPMKQSESVVTIKKPLVAGKPWLEVRNVSNPTMTVYKPKGKNTGAAVVVFPGGGYIILAIGLEGTEICHWLTSQGITCVLLKYRVPAPRSAPNWGAYPESPMALEDAQRTIGLVRLNAKKWHINPDKIGVIGFSAGGSLVAEISTHYKKRLYKSIDAADKKSCRPDFAIAIYPGHLWINPKKFTLNPNIPVTRQTPLTFLLQAEDDPVDSINNSLVYYIALKNEKVPVEMHLYAHGGHAFGLRPTKFPITRWPHLVDIWLHTIGVIS